MELYTITIGNTHALGGVEYICQLIQEEMHNGQAFDVTIKPVENVEPKPKHI